MRFAYDIHDLYASFALSLPLCSHHSDRFSGRLDGRGYSNYTDSYNNTVRFDAYDVYDKDSYENNIYTQVRGNLVFVLNIFGDFLSLEVMPIRLVRKVYTHIHDHAFICKYLSIIRDTVVSVLPRRELHSCRRLCLRFVSILRKSVPLLIRAADDRSR
jgi:hypothetical protein